MISTRISKIISDNIDLIESGDFERLYKVTRRVYGAELTKTLYSAGVNPLEGSNKIYDGMFAYYEAPDDQILEYTIPRGIEFIEKYAFFSSEFHSITISKDVKQIFSEAFAYSSISDLYFEDGSNLTQIDDSAFATCGRLSGNIYFPDVLESIGDMAFQFTSLNAIYLPDNLQNLGDKCFRKTPLTKVRIPRNIKFIGEDVFSGCDRLKVIDIPERLLDTQEEKRLTDGNDAKIRVYK